MATSTKSMADHPAQSLDPTVRKFYDRWPEENRLGVGPFKLEEARTRELILRHAPPPPGPVLDVGGAAGAYAFWLAERGYDVQLIDATPRLVDVARERNRSASHKLAACRVGDARALADANESATMVLMLGPLYHLVEQTDRRVAISEAWRVLRPGGVLIAAGISRAASTLDGLSREMLADADFSAIVERDLRDGRHLNPTDNPDYFTTAYFHRPEDLRREVADAGFEAAVYGIEGPGWMLPDFEQRWSDPQRRETMLQAARKLESEPSIIGCSAHLIVVGRKPSTA